MYYPANHLGPVSASNLFLLGAEDPLTWNTALLRYSWPTISYTSLKCTTDTFCLLKRPTEPEIKIMNTPWFPKVSLRPSVIPLSCPSPTPKLSGTRGKFAFSRTLYKWHHTGCTLFFWLGRFHAASFFLAPSRSSFSRELKPGHRPQVHRARGKVHSPVS